MSAIADAVSHGRQIKLSRVITRTGDPHPRLPMHHSHRTTGLGILALIGLVLLYYIWPDLVGFLAVVGAAQVYRVWHDRYGR